MPSPLLDEGALVRRLKPETVMTLATPGSERAIESTSPMIASVRGSAAASGNWTSTNMTP